MPRISGRLIVPISARRIRNALCSHRETAAVGRKSVKFYQMSKQKSRPIPPSLRMALIEAQRPKGADGGKETALRDWLRALEATAPIAADPQRVLPRVIEDVARKRGNASALISARES